MAGLLSVADVAAVSASAVGPGVETSGGRGKTARIDCRSTRTISGTIVCARVTATVGASAALVVVRSRGAHERNYLSHLREEGSLTSCNRGLMGLNRSSSNIGGR